MKKFIFSILIAMMLLTGASYSTQSEAASEPKAVDEAAFMNMISAENYITEPIVFAEQTETTESEESFASEEDIRLLALLTMTEAEGECEEGQRLVIDVVLNRVDNPYFPDTIYDVVYQKNQFSGMYGARVAKCYVKDELVQLVREELAHRTNYDVVFFRTKHYHSYGVPMFQVGAHYFSSYS